MIKFSKNTLEFFPTIPKNIFITFVKKWCDGTEISIDTQKNWEKNFIPIESNLDSQIQIYVEEKYFSLIDNGFISLVKNRWIFSHSENILSHCWCGKSFAFKSENDVQDKIFLLKKKLRKHKHIHHDN